MATTKRNPKKSLVTISTNGEVLTVNKHACRLWGVSGHEIVGLSITKLLNQNLFGVGTSQMEFWDEALSAKGEVVKINGKVMKAMTSRNEEVPVSVWLKRLPSRKGVKGREDERAILVIEPVELTMGILQVDAHGNINELEAWLPTLFGFESESELIGKSLSLIIPSLKSPFDIPPTEGGYSVTGKTKSGTFFPLILDLMVAREFIEQGPSVLTSLNALLPLAVTVFRSISGLVSLKPNGTIYGCNHNFSTFIFGYGDKELREEPITKVIPDFYQQVEQLDEESYLDQTNYSSFFDQTQGSDVFSSSLLSNPSKRISQLMQMATPPLNVISSILAQTHNKNTGMQETKPSPQPSQRPQSGQTNRMDYTTMDGSPVLQPNISQIPTSSPVSPNSDAHTLLAIPDGAFSTKASHKDGSQLGVHVQLRKVPLSGGRVLVCLWISRVEDDQRTRQALDMSQSFRSQQGVADTLNVSKLNVTSEEAYAPESGEFIKHFILLKEIGSGAFGHVNLCRRIGTSAPGDEIVVVKFLCKSKVFQESWVQDQEFGRVPKEILVLSRLKHPNVVELLEVYENPSYYQLVMRKHGDGMDLFDFIEMHPLLDEALISYIFRQIVDGVAYLHSCHIAHRDIKDENVIIDERFSIRLIDFGSADFMEAGKLFATFCGTMEYCSPEILLGNKYYGPELEVWTMGIILYTMTFFENPFVDVEEAIEGKLTIPFRVSGKLTQLVFQVLDPNPASRATIDQLLSNRWINQKVDIKRYNFYAVTRGQSGQDTSSILETEASPARNLNPFSSPVANMRYKANMKSESF